MKRIEPEDRAKFNLEELLAGNIQEMSDDEFASLVGLVQRNQMMLHLATKGTEPFAESLPDVIREEVARRIKLRSCAEE